jgi:transposase
VSNILKVNLQEAIKILRERGWSHRRIAEELGVNRRTVKGYTGRCKAKCTISIAGKEEDGSSKCTISTLGLRAEEERGGVGRRSDCEPLAEIIGGKLELGLSAQRIYQDLVAGNGFAGSYQSVKRYAARIKARQPERVWRMECRPGEEVQVDFGLGAPIDEGNGKSRRSWVFRMVLSYSRKGYSEAVQRQDTESFLRCLENAVRSFGGAPLLLNLDNLKAAVVRADWFDPEINPRLAEFCRHYGMSVLPCRPYRPQHKGKVERGIGYVRGNALKGCRFGSLNAQNLHLQQWEKNVADTRIHGTTRQQVATCFAEERTHLQPLPPMIFPCYQEARRTVHRDSYVEVARAYYEVAPEYIGRKVWVRWDSRCVRVLNDRLEQVAMHVRMEAGKFSRSLGVMGLSAPVRSSCRYWVERAAVLGEACGAWAQQLVDRRGPEALRTIMALCAMIKRHSGRALERACARAIAQGLWRYKDLRRLLEKGSGDEQQSLHFAQDHPLIRNLQNYADFIETHATTTHP